jgi:hypothetical protein
MIEKLEGTTKSAEVSTPSDGDAERKTQECTSKATLMLLVHAGAVKKKHSRGRREGWQRSGTQEI